MQMYTNTIGNSNIQWQRNMFEHIIKLNNNFDVNAQACANTSSPEQQAANSLQYAS